MHSSSYSSLLRPPAVCLRLSPAANNANTCSGHVTISSLNPLITTLSFLLSNIQMANAGGGVMCIANDVDVDVCPNGLTPTRTREQIINDLIVYFHKRYTEEVFPRLVFLIVYIFRTILDGKLDNPLRIPTFLLFLFPFIFVEAHTPIQEPLTFSTVALNGKCLPCGCLAVCEDTYMISLHHGTFYLSLVSLSGPNVWSNLYCDFRAVLDSWGAAGMVLVLVLLVDCDCVTHSPPMTSHAGSAYVTSSLCVPARVAICWNCCGCGCASSDHWEGWVGRVCRFLFLFRDPLMLCLLDLIWVWIWWW